MKKAAAAPEKHQAWQKRGRFLMNKRLWFKLCDVVDDAVTFILQG